MILINSFFFFFLNCCSSFFSSSLKKSKIIFDCIHEILSLLNGKVNFLFKFHEISMILLRSMLIKIKRNRNILLIHSFHFLLHIIQVLHFILRRYHRLRRHRLRTATTSSIHVLTIITTRRTPTLRAEIRRELLPLRRGIRRHIHQRTITLRNTRSFIE